jgi:excisionase family DNA binding protein
MTKLLTILEVSEMLGGVSRRTVERLIASGQLRAKKIGSRTFVTDREVEAFIASRRAA